MATGLHAHYPNAGDLSVCIACSNVSVYTGELLQRTPWPEGKTVPDDVQLLQRAIRQLRS